MKAKNRLARCKCARSPVSLVVLALFGVENSARNLVDGEIAGINLYLWDYDNSDTVFERSEKNDDPYSVCSRFINPGCDGRPRSLSKVLDEIRACKHVTQVRPVSRVARGTT